MASETKWTPGPWKVSGSGHVKASIDGKERIVAEVSGWNAGDARLISAAPELYETLWDLVSLAQERDLTAADLDAACAALAKARGEQP